MKAYKVTLLIVDHDEVGDRIKEHIENVRYPNHCLRPTVMEVQEADIGEWDDDHPLNHYNTMEEEFDKLFK
jgi:hypothetical protein